MRIKVRVGLSLVFLFASPIHGQQELLLDRPKPNMDVGIEAHPHVATIGDTVSIVISARN